MDSLPRIKRNICTFQPVSPRALVWRPHALSAYSVFKSALFFFFSLKYANQSKLNLAIRIRPIAVHNYVAQRFATITAQKKPASILTCSYPPSRPVLWWTVPRLVMPALLSWVGSPQARGLPWMP